MAATSLQKQKFVTGFRALAEQVARTMAQAATYKDMYTDLGLSSGITDADLVDDNAGLSAADVTAALGTVNSMLTEYTAARRASLNKISHGAP
jgi:hypothetical protein